MQDLKEKLIVALDVGRLDKAIGLVERLYPEGVKIFKVGSQLFTACGREIVEIIGRKGAKVFLDLKFYDIPKTVFSAVSSATGLACESMPAPTLSLDAADKTKKSIQPTVFMITVHIADNKKMLEQAVRGAEEKARDLNIKRPFIVGVTVLTSEAANERTGAIVLERARLAKDAGLDGIVCSFHETAKVRKEFGPGFIIVNPGIRPKGYVIDDQSRTATAREAADAGADYIVVGRPILEAKDPIIAIEDILKS